jgi:hypothetical protein
VLACGARGAFDGARVEQESLLRGILFDSVLFDSIRSAAVICAIVIIIVVIIVVIIIIIIISAVEMHEKRGTVISANKCMMNEWGKVRGIDCP